jgi:hypothetical protein
LSTNHGPQPVLQVSVAHPAPSIDASLRGPDTGGLANHSAQGAFRLSDEARVLPKTFPAQTCGVDEAWFPSPQTSDRPQLAGFFTTTNPIHFTTRSALATPHSFLNASNSVVSLLEPHQHTHQQLPPLLIGLTLLCCSVICLSPRSLRLTRLLLAAAAAASFRALLQGKRLGLSAAEGLSIFLFSRRVALSGSL